CPLNDPHRHLRLVHDRQRSQIHRCLQALKSLQGHPLRRNMDKRII
ncbi:hypothetical protein GCK32_022593, partial [Trichostrongylus colubriformis]